jgi:Tfp pilus assembly protein PilF
MLLTVSGVTSELHAGIVSGTAAPSNPIRLPEGIPEMHQAVERFKNGDYEQCQALLTSATAKNPDLPPALLLFAKLCLLLDRATMGREVLEQVVVEHPDLPETHVVFGRLALQERRLTDAQLQFDKALELTAAGSWSDRRRNGLLVEAHDGLAAVAEPRKAWPAVLAHLTACLQLEPKSGQFRQRKGAALFRQGERQKAHAELEQAVKDDPSLESAAILMGRLFAEEGNLTKAAEWMDYAVKLAPDDAKTRLGYATWLFEQDQPEKARPHAEAASRLAPNSADARGLCGLIAWQLKDYATAERIFRELHLETPGNVTASNFWALSLAEQPSDAQRTRARQVAEINVQLQSKSAEALTTLGWVDYRLGQLDQAEQSLRAAIATGKGSSETAYYLARVLADRQKNDEVPQLLKVSFSASGRFAFRNDAQTWLDQLQKTREVDATKTSSN